MSEMSLREQITRLEEMKSYLKDFCSIMRNTMDELDNDIKFLKGEGLSIETEESYRKRYYNPANENVQEVINDVYGKHFDYINDIVEELKRAEQQ